MAEILKNQGSHKILAIMVGMNQSPLELIETAGRTAYQSRDKITEGSALKFAEMIRNRGHESVIEHSSMIVEFNNVSRGFTHELVRHRIASFTQESTRYVDESDFKVIIPPTKDGSEELIELELPNKEKIKISFNDWVNLNEQMYRGLRKANWIPEDARQILPIGIKSQIVVTTNFREWRHIFKLRTNPRSHWEIRRVTTNLLQDVKEKVPVIFNDIKV